jgi:hypothetical protein
VVTFGAEGDEVTFNVLASQPFVCRVVNFEPVHAAVMVARLASAVVDQKPRGTPLGPLH